MIFSRHEGKKNIGVMLAGILIIGSGEELWIRFVPRYLELLGASAFIIAFYGSLKDFLDAIYQYPGGWLADRLGRRNALILFTVLAVVGYVTYFLADHWGWILLGTLFVMAWSSLTLPALFAVIGDNLPPASRATGFGVQSILKRVPIVIAPVLGGWIMKSKGLASGTRTGLLITVVLALLSIYIFKRFYVESSRPARDDLRIGSIWRSMDRHLKTLLVSDCLARWAEGIPKVFVVLYVLNVLKLDELSFGWLTAIAMMTSIVFYIPSARMSDRWNRRPFILATFFFFALFPLMMTFTSGFWSLAVAFVFAGLREFGEPSRKALIVDLARESARGRAVGLYYLIRGLVVFPASLVGGWLWKIHPDLPFYLACGIGLASVAFYAASSKNRFLEKTVEGSES